MFKRKENVGALTGVCAHHLICVCVWCCNNKVRRAKSFRWKKKNIILISSPHVLMLLSFPFFKIIKERETNQVSIKTFLLHIYRIYMHFSLLYTPVQLVLLHRSSSHLMMMTIMMMMLYTVGFWCGVYSLLENCCCWTALWINPIYMCVCAVFIPYAGTTRNQLDSNFS